MSNMTLVEHINGRRVWDSRGRPTVEADVVLTSGAFGRAIAPAGASKGSGEALDRRDGGSAFGGHDVKQAVQAISDQIAPALKGLDATDQPLIDETMIDLDGSAAKERLGANATIAVSMAVAHAAADAAGLPLYRYLAGDKTLILPLPEIQIFGGGAHAGRRTDIQDFMIVCPGAATFAEALDWTAEVYRAAGQLMDEAGLLAGVADEGGYWPAFETNEQALNMLVRAIEQAGFYPGAQVAIALDVAASEFGREGRYRLALEDRDLDTSEMIELLLSWLKRYPIVSIEDPLAEDDIDGFREFTAKAGDKVQVVGDDLLVTDAERVHRIAALGAANALLVKPNQRGTLTETKAAFDAARIAGFDTIVSARSGETEDITIAHLVVGWNAGQFKVGSFTRSERMAKWNEVLRIEEAIDGQGRFAGRAALRG
ncbi:MAG: phosphopyruvate hydratase [Geminicoccales bacterium]